MPRSEVEAIDRFKKYYQLLDKALETDGIAVTCKTAGLAINLRQRLNQARKTWREYHAGMDSTIAPDSDNIFDNLDDEGFMKENQIGLKYDSLTITIDYKNNNNVVEIRNNPGEGGIPGVERIARLSK